VHFVEIKVIFRKNLLTSELRFTQVVLILVSRGAVTGGAVTGGFTGDLVEANCNWEESVKKGTDVPAAVTGREVARTFLQLFRCKE